MEVEVWEMDPLKASRVQGPRSAHISHTCAGGKNTEPGARWNITSLIPELVGLWETFAGAGTGSSSRGLPGDTLDSYPMFFPSEGAGAHTIRMSPCYG